MKTFVGGWIWIVFLAAGCENQVPMTKLPPALGGQTAPLELSVSSARPIIGQSIEVRVVATNATAQTMRVVSPDSGLIVLRLWRRIPTGWTEYLHFPETVLPTLNPWSLAPGERRRFEISVPVDHRWPTYETLRLTAELNGTISESRPVELLVTPAPK